MQKRFKRLLALLLPGLLLFGFTPALSEITIEIVWKEAGVNYVEYPQLLGMPNTFVQDTVNAAILQAIEPHLNTLTVLKSGVDGDLKVDATTQVFKHDKGQDILAVLMVAQGRMPTGRSGYQAIPLMFSLVDAQPLPITFIFQDQDLAKNTIEEDLNGQFAEDLSNYLDTSALIPFPIDSFLLSDTGITFYYKENSLTWLSGRTASITYLYEELRPLLNLGDDALLSGLNLMGLQPLSAASKELIQKTVSEGSLPGLDVHLGNNIQEAIAKNKLQYDSEGFPTGESFQLEDDRYRGTKVIADENGRVTALLSTRMNLYGLFTGQTQKAEIINALGQSLATIPLDAAAAGLYGLKEGTLLTYRFGVNDLKLHLDASDILSAIWLENIT